MVWARAENDAELAGWAYRDVTVRLRAEAAG
jgi:hypothetical protein